MKIVVDEFEILWFVVCWVGHIHHEPEDDCKCAKEPAKNVEEPLPGVRVEFLRGRHWL